ncbi:unnamed protein product [Pleuronectes platessa]|uniref:Uncharacterized protein n=1 Tax=Pleuronectes platessa TaxID=8262 RepID=A0A9N7V163_PLEPL|nr:unnamed protein product [Pleuronectes platessa]
MDMEAVGASVLAGGSIFSTRLGERDAGKVLTTHPESGCFLKTGFMLEMKRGSLNLVQDFLQQLIGADTSLSTGTRVCVTFGFDIYHNPFYLFHNVRIQMDLTSCLRVQGDRSQRTTVQRLDCQDSKRPQKVTGSIRNFSPPLPSGSPCVVSTSSRLSTGAIDRLRGGASSSEVAGVIWVILLSLVSELTMEKQPVVL